MRKPKHYRVKRGVDEATYDFTAHVPSTAFVRVAVTEREKDGTLIVDLEKIEGPVKLEWTGADGKRHGVLLPCACNHGSHCTVSHDPSKCSCRQCTTATAQARRPA